MVAFDYVDRHLPMARIEVPWETWFKTKYGYRSADGRREDSFEGIVVGRGLITDVNHDMVELIHVVEAGGICAFKIYLYDKAGKELDRWVAPND